MDSFLKGILEIDFRGIAFLNQFAGDSWLLNKLAFILARNNLVTTVPVMALLWWGWFKGDERVRMNVMSTFLACFFACIIFLFVRETHLMWENRLRPICDANVHFQIPVGLKPNLDQCRTASSSFPSGHTAVLAALGIGLLPISRALGIGCLIFSFFFVLIPRVYVGYHFPSDMVGGALIGIFTIWLAHAGWTVKRAAEPLVRWSKRHPPSFYAAFFIASYIVATFFMDIRTILQELLKIGR
jgi:undecaprenyl-diphosphatase